MSKPSVLIDDISDPGLKKLFAEKGVGQYCILYQHSVNKKHDSSSGRIDFHEISERLDAGVAYEGGAAFGDADVVMLDFENPYTAAMVEGEGFVHVDAEGNKIGFAEIKQSLIDTVVFLKGRYPEKKWGYYGFPEVPIWLCDPSQVINRDCPNVTRLDQASQPQIDALMDHLHRNFKELIDVCDIFGPSLYQHDLKDGDGYGNDNLDRAKSSLGAKLCSLLDPNGEKMKMAWVSSMYFRELILQKDTLRGFEFIPFEELKSDTLLPWMSGGMDGFVVWMAMDYRVNQLTSPLSADSAVSEEQLALRSAFLDGVMDGAGADPTDDKYWTNPNNRAVFASAFTAHALEFCGKVMESNSPVVDVTQMIPVINRHWYSWKPVASINNGVKSWNNLAYISQFVGKPVSGQYDSYSQRAFRWEADPADPSKSSPWHNYIYERVIDDYAWGARAFAFWLPYGDYNINPTTEGVAPASTDFMKGAFGLTQVLQKKRYTKVPLELTNPNGVVTSISDADGKKRLDLLARCPAVWKGFKESVKALVEGRLIPDASTGRSPINEPCRVMVYISSCRGWSGYRYRSNLLWDSFYKECKSKTHLAKKTYADTKFYQYLDEWVSDIVAMRGTVAGTEGNLAITLDAISTSATPSTIELYRSMPDYRSDLLELADWYVLERLTEDFGIQTFYESRCSKVKRQAEVANTDDGGIPFPNSNKTPTGGKGSYSLDPSGVPKAFQDDKFCYPFVQSEDDFWLKESQRTVYTDIASPDDVETMWRLMRIGGYPPPTDNNGQFDSDVYGAKLNVSHKGVEYPISNGYRGNSPHSRMWWTYALADSYRYLYNKFFGQRFGFVKTKYDHVNCYEAALHRDGLYTEGAYNGVDNPDFAYWKLDLKMYDYRAPFDGAAFAVDPSGYPGGWWTPEGKAAWDEMFRSTSLGGFLAKLDAFAASTVPKGSGSVLPQHPGDPFTSAVTC